MKYSSCALLGLLTLSTAAEPKGPKTKEEKDLMVKSVQQPQKTRPGTQTITTRVVGGEQVTKPSQYPFFVEWEDAKCGASLIWGGT